MSRMGDPENSSDDEYGISRVKIKKKAAQMAAQV
jgi:hypothetical protein